MCYTMLDNKEEMNKHMNEKHSPDSFYEKLVEDISGTCWICLKSFIPSGLDAHIKSEHNICKNNVDGEVESVIEDVLNKVIDLSDSESEEPSEVDEDDINIDFDYSVEKVSCKETYKGKKPLFVQYVKELKQLLSERGDVNAKTINKHIMVVKDAREVSYGMEFDIEISGARMKGLAKVQIWGPSTKKNSCTIIISKYHKSDPTFATKLSRKIIKPLLESYLKGNGWKDIITKSSKVNKDKVQCNSSKKFFGNQYLKTHMVKMHNHTCVACKDTFKSKENLNHHKSQAHSQVENKAQTKTVKEEVVIRNLRNSYTFKQCNIKFQTKMELFAHNEKTHIHDNWPDSGSKQDFSMVKTSSVSEPKKKKAAEEEVMMERSNNMDKKILDKRKKEELEEMLRYKEIQEQKRKEEVNSEIEKKRKKKEKEKYTKEIEQVNEETKLPPNVKELPPCVKSLYPDCVQFCVAGDGACCLNCLAAWILLDASLGPQLGRDLNTHLAEYREYYINKLSFPLTITIAGGEMKVFDVGEENDFFDMLVTSPEASFMWRGSADITGLTNFTKMKEENSYLQPSHQYGGGNS